MWHSSNNCEQINISFWRNLRGDLIMVMFSTIQFRICPLVYCLKKSKDWNIQDYNFVCGSVWVRNLVSYTYVMT
jgi:hypothetical protein